MTDAIERFFQNKLRPVVEEQLRETYETIFEKNTNLLSKVTAFVRSGFSTEKAGEYILRKKLELKDNDESTEEQLLEYTLMLLTKEDIQKIGVIISRRVAQQLEEEDMKIPEDIYLRLFRGV
jgi:hypothetical protein